MKLIILTQYFPPEIGAPQNRLFELAVRLKNAGVEITVLTAMPNYPQMQIHDSYKGKRYAYEEIDGIKVHRSRIYIPRSKSIFARLLNYFSFVNSSYWTGRRKLENADFLLVESPPLFLGMSATRLAKRKNAKLIFNVSDLWPESAEKLGLVTNKLFLKMAYRLEASLYNKSALITGQTQGIVKSISDRFPKNKVYWLKNGTDLTFFDAQQHSRNWRSDNGFEETDRLFLYAGIIGHAQGLEVIIEAASRFLQNNNVKFIILGSGPEKEKLLALSKELTTTNVIFYDAVSKQEMPAIISACNATIIPLKKLDLFKGAIPSKIFESLAMEKPLLLGVEGEAKELFIDQANAGLFFEPGSAEKLTDAINILLNQPDLFDQLGTNGRNFVSIHFNRDTIASEFFKFLSENLK
ncbi:MAG: glycosyltransferase family 4 protein [Bacteroidetes bacterium]|nr:glycosyltransferase family 4 protein [Bacteroidota bacterium]MBU1720638.1 glycosyltransferase family 4 protein [Bacteroidota bacterium]